MFLISKTFIIVKNVVNILRKRTRVLLLLFFLSQSQYFVVNRKEKKTFQKNQNFYGNK